MLESILKFAGEHHFLTWCALWLGWAVFVIIMVLLKLVSILLNRVLRTVKVLARGWPPAHLDADGDWKPEPEPEPEQEEVTDQAGSAS